VLKNIFFVWRKIQDWAFLGIMCFSREQLAPFIGPATIPGGNPSKGVVALGLRSRVRIQDYKRKVHRATNEPSCLLYWSEYSDISSAVEKEMKNALQAVYA
jgi:hypothetical protein